MKILLNGTEYTLENVCTVEELLRILEMNEKPVVVEWNGQAISPSEFSSTMINDGDRLEIISIVAGG